MVLEIAINRLGALRSDTVGIIRIDTDAENPEPEYVQPVDAETLEYLELCVVVAKGKAAAARARLEEAKAVLESVPAPTP